MEPTIEYSIETMSLPKLRRRGAYFGNFTSTGNTEDNFKYISSYLGNDELIHLFFNIFDNLIGKVYDNFEDRIDSFTHNWLSIHQLIAIIVYLNNDFLDIFTTEINDSINHLFIDLEVLNKLTKIYNMDDNEQRLKIAKNFLNNIEY